MTKRQKAYRKYLQSEHWKSLRQQTIDRDGGKCVRCPSSHILQVHHKKYRFDFESTVIDDLETLCRDCHRLEHGFGPDEFTMLWRHMEHLLNTDQMPTKEDEMKLFALGHSLDLQWDVEAMFRRVAMARIPRNRWSHWIEKPYDVHMRLFSWSERKYLTLAGRYP